MQIHKRENKFFARRVAKPQKKKSLLIQKLFRLLQMEKYERKAELVIH